MQAHLLEVFSLAKIVFYPIKKFPFMLPSHNCIIIDSMFSFQGTSRRNQIHNFAFHASVKCLPVSLFLLFHSNPLALGFEWSLSLLRNSMKFLVSKELQSISLVEISGIAFLRKSHGGYNMPPACCQEPPFDPAVLFLVNLNPLMKIGGD